MKRTLLSLLICMLAAGVSGQSKIGMHLDNGVWKQPTLQSALDVIESDYQPALAILRQKFGPVPSSELDAFADELGRLMREGTQAQVSGARTVLMSATVTDSDGTAYAKAADVFIRLYESYDDRLSMDASTALLGVFQAGGASYVRKLFESSEKPKACQICGGLTQVDCNKVDNPCPNTGTWCQAGGILAIYGEKGAALKSWSDLCFMPRY